MNIVQKGFISGVAILLSLALVIPAFAQISVTSETNAQAGVTVGSSSAGVSGSADIGVGAGAGTNAGSSGSVDGDAQIVVTQNTATDIESTVSSVGEVRSSAELSGYIATQIKSDENLSSVSSGSENVEVTYNQRAKLFAILPVTVKVTTHVAADGTVKVKYPWYAFLMTTNRADLETKVQAAVSASGSTSASADATAELSAQAQARIVSAVKAVMETELEAALQLEASAKVN